ncbi:MAG: MoxR family ATPase [Pseudomonadales bacterium]|nr:MoxR family ATPase [Pseudomonadales bacterium]MBL6815514.1 MoxR family ATPase [Pseudomonadales bacterium]
MLQQVEADTSSLVELLDRAHQVLAQHWLGDDFVIEVLLTSIIAKGHVLLVDVPGVGKTTLAKSMAQVLGLDFNRIQFTNDILPADILGGSIYSATDGKFSFAPGPIFTDFLLADEINRGPTRSQSAFLQAMEEGFVAAEGKNYPLSDLFTVIATQNPIDFDSTNPLPEAQLDRFLTSVTLGYPSDEAELHLLGGYNAQAQSEPEAILNKESVDQLREASDKVHLHEDLMRYIVDISRKTREDQRIKLGISPRGSMNLANAAKAYALVKGRQHVLAEDIQKLIPPVWDHRILPRHGRDSDSAHSHEILQDLVAQTPVPR